MVGLEGAFVNPKTGEKGDIRISRLSIEGVEFSLNDFADVEHGQTLALSFTLDNAMRTPVERNIKVTSVKNGRVGAMFIGTVRNKTVGFYLMP